MQIPRLSSASEPEPTSPLVAVCPRDPDPCENWRTIATGAGTLPLPVDCQNTLHQTDHIVSVAQISLSVLVNSKMSTEDARASCIYH